MSTNIVNGTLGQIIGKVNIAMMVDSSGNAIDTFGGGGGTGDVSGPASSTINGIATYADTTGKLIQDSLVTIDNTGTIGVVGGGGISSISGNSLIGIYASSGVYVGGGQGDVTLSSSSNVVLSAGGDITLGNGGNITLATSALTSNTSSTTNFTSIGDLSLTSTGGDFLVSSTGQALIQSNIINLDASTNLNLNANYPGGAGGGGSVTVNGDSLSIYTSLVPGISGNYSVGTAALPFASGVFNNISANGTLNITANNTIVSGSASSMKALSGFNYGLVDISPTATTIQQTSSGQDTYVSVLANQIITKGILRPISTASDTIGTVAFPYASGVFNNYLTTRVSGAVTTATTTVDWSQGASQILTWANGQPSGTTLLFSGMTAGSSYALETSNNASGTGIITWPATVKWQGQISGTLTPTASSSDLFTFYCTNGSTMFGNYSNNYK